MNNFHPNQTDFVNYFMQPGRVMSDHTVEVLQLTEAGDTLLAMAVRPAPYNTVADSEVETKVQCTFYYINRANPKIVNQYHDTYEAALCSMWNFMEWSCMERGLKIAVTHTTVNMSTMVDLEPVLL